MPPLRAIWTTVQAFTARDHLSDAPSRQSEALGWITGGQELSSAAGSAENLALAGRGEIAHPVRARIDELRAD